MKNDYKSNTIYSSIILIITSIIIIGLLFGLSQISILEKIMQSLP